MTTELGLSNLSEGQRIQISIHGIYTVLSNSTLGEQRIIKLRKDGIADDNRYYIEENPNKLTFTDRGENNQSSFIRYPGTVHRVTTTPMLGKPKTSPINYSDITMSGAVGAAGGKNKSRRNKRNKKSRKNNRKSRKY